MIIHASCVAIEGKGLLVLGASGRGKSSLALSLMAMGAVLVADDRVVLSRENEQLIACAPAPISGLIEARGIGLLHARTQDRVAVTCVINLDQIETERLPHTHEIALLDQTLPLLFNVDAPHFPAAIMQYMKQGRHQAT